MKTMLTHLTLKKMRGYPYILCYEMEELEFGFEEKLTIQSEFWPNQRKAVRDAKSAVATILLSKITCRYVAIRDVL